MKGTQNVYKNILIWTRRTLFWLATAIILLLFVLLILLQTPVFQNFLGGKVLTFINTNTRETAKFTNIRIKWFDFVEIKDFELLDYQGNVMVKAASLKVDYQLSDLISGSRISFDQLALSDAEVHMTKYKDTLGINVVEFINDLSGLSPKDSSSSGKGKSTELLVGQIELERFEFSYDNQLKDSLSQGLFDYGHFVLDVSNGEFDGFRVVGDTIEANIESFDAKDERSGFELVELSSFFRVSSSGLELSDLYLQTLNSTITDRISLKYNGYDDLGYFVDSVSLEIDLVNSNISKKDIGYFASIPGPDFSVHFDGKISGTVPALSLDNINLTYGEKSQFKGSIDCMGLPNIDETFIDARVEQAKILITDLEEFLEPKTLSKIKGLEELTFDGHFLGFTHDFVAQGDFTTSLGGFSSDVNLKFSEGWENADYSGDLRLMNFDVGQLIGKPQYVGKVNLIGNVKGSGVNPETARLYLDAKLVDSELYGYHYDTIQANGQLASEFFKGNLIIADPNCRIKSEGQVDISMKPEKINIQSNIGYVNLQNLGFVNDFLSIKGEVDANISGLDMDSLQGELKIANLNTRWKTDSLKLDSILISSFSKNRERNIKLLLPDLRMDINGNFYFSELVKDLKILSSEVRGYFDPDYSNEEEFYREEDEVNQYSIDFEVAYNDISSYIQLLNSDIYLSPKGVIEGTYYQRKNATLSLFTEIDSINYQDIGYKNNTFDINFSKDLDSAGIIASVFINSAKQVWRNIPETRDFSLEAVWFNDKISLNTSIAQPANNSSASVKSELKLQQDRLTFSFLPSRVIAFGEQWFFNPFNKVVVTENNVMVDRLELYQNSESILLSGTYSDSAQTGMSLKIKDFSLKNLRPLIAYDLDGVLNSVVDFKRSSNEESYVFDGDVSLEEFKMNDFLIGNVTGKSKWDTDKKQLGIDFNVSRKGMNTIDIRGIYSPEDVGNELDINARFNQANLQLANPFLQSLFSNIAGKASGEVDISGSPSQPVIIGSTDVESGLFKFNYLGTTYGFSGNIAFDNESIKFNGMRLLDKDQNKASFSGVIKHEFFNDFETDLTLSVSNFQLLNTTYEENSLYYGTANATGDVKVIGPVDDLLIKANVTTNKGTKIYIPLSGSSEEVTQKEYISFVDLKDTTQSVDLDEIVKNSISGVRLDFEVDVTPDAYVELIFDIRTGDIIRGRGNGNLNLSLDTNGEFELFGDLTITEGAYNFTIPNFINKEFTVEQGSTISWYGDPYAGVLNLDATYRQLASPMDYLSSTSEDDESVNQKYPVLVVVKLTGDMLSPSIDFEIRLEDSQASPTADVERVITSINSNEQELKRQVFSLLILRKISPQSNFEIGTGAVQGSLSEFFSNQFSYFISQVDENLEVDVDLSSLDQNAFNTFQLRLSYTFLDGRLRVSGGGGIPQEGDDTSNSSFIGDWSVRYLLTPDGHLRVKAFSQTEQLASSLIRETGVSFQYLKSFNDFRELMTKTREESITTTPKDISKEIEANKNLKPSSK